MKRSILLSYFLLPGLATGLMFSCDKGNKDSSNSKESGTPDKAGNASETSPGKPPLLKERVKTKEICSEVFSPEFAAKVTRLDISGLELLAHGGGACNIGTGNSPFRLGFAVSTVRKRTADASFYFDNMTQNRTAKESQAVIESLATKSEELDPGTKKKARPVTQAIGSNMPDMHFTDLDAIGDRARLSTQTYNGTTDYSIYVLVRNIVFMVNVDGKTMDDAAKQNTSKELAAAIANKIAAF